MPNSSQPPRSAIGPSQVSTFSAATQSWKPSSFAGAAPQNLSQGPSASKSTTGTIWPESKKSSLATAAVKALTAVPQNAGKPLRPEQICDLLDKNPSYIELCESLENMDFFVDRAKFARLLLAAVPDANDTPAAPSAPQTPHYNRNPPVQTPTRTLLSSPQTSTPGPKPSSPLTINLNPSGSSDPPKKCPGRPRKDGTPAQPRKKAINETALTDSFSKNYMNTAPTATITRSGTEVADPESQIGPGLEAIDNAEQRTVNLAAQQVKSRGRPRKDGSPAQPRKKAINDGSNAQGGKLYINTRDDRDNPSTAPTVQPAAAFGDPGGTNISRLQANGDTRQRIADPTAQQESAVNQPSPGHAIPSTVSALDTSHPYACSHCFARFTGKDKLKRHVDIVHEHIRYTCSHCGLGLTRPEHLRRHLQNVHSISSDASITPGLSSQDIATTPASTNGISSRPGSSKEPHSVDQTALQTAQDPRITAATRARTSLASQASTQQTPTPVTNTPVSTRSSKQLIFVNGNGNAYLAAAQRVSADVANMTSRYRLENPRAYAAASAASAGSPFPSQSNITEPDPKQAPSKTSPYSPSQPSNPNTTEDKNQSTQAMTKEKAARKRTFGEIVDLTQDLSEDEAAYPSKPPRLDDNKTNNHGNAPHVSEQNASGDAIDLTNDISPPADSDERLQAEQTRRQAENALRNADVVERIDKKKALRRSSYNPKTIARDVLLAAGRHPSMRALNAHLDILKTTMRNVDNNTDLSTFKWDIVDPRIDVEDLAANSKAIEEADADADDEGDEVDPQEQHDISSPYFNNRRRVAAIGGDQAGGDTGSCLLQPNLDSLHANSWLVGGVEVVVAAKQLRGPRRRGPSNRGRSSGINGPGIRSRPATLSDMGAGEGQSSSSHRRNNGGEAKRSTQPNPSSPFTPVDTGEPAVTGSNQPPSGPGNTAPAHNLPLRGAAQSEQPFKKPRGRPRGSSRRRSLSSSGTRNSSRIGRGGGSSREQSSIPERPRKPGSPTPSRPSGLRHASAVSGDLAVVIPSRSPSIASIDQKASKRSKAASQVLQSSNSMYQVFHCQWRGCKAELHNLETLRKHVQKIHRNKATHGRLPCYWAGCRNVVNGKDRETGELKKTVEALEFDSEASWDEHMDEKHLETIAWALGDGPSSERSGISQPSPQLTSL